MLNVFAVEMAMAVSDENIKEVLDYMKSDDASLNGDLCNRFEFIYLLLATGCMDYIKEMGLKKNDSLHKAIVSGLIKLASIHTWGNIPISYSEMCKYLISEVIPVWGPGFFEYDEFEGIYEVPKKAVDNWLSAIDNTLEVMLTENKWADHSTAYGCICELFGGQPLFKNKGLTSRLRGASLVSSLDTEDDSVDIDL